ncbi:MAG TPA: family 2A encapsulin nanocompartment cargo protein cysteine desulfurase [Terriglobales bacterium]|jgi:cysteine desulfurase/selenocysteine lyase|nr:family 2A encapsulin nanocompartment cargo protein cysteine desulfurase [Terriglobales bacterium]
MSTNTMSTSDRVVEEVPTADANAPPNPFTGLASLPNPDVIARLANEFFVALPGSGALPSSVAGAPSPDTGPVTETVIAAPKSAAGPYFDGARATPFGAIPSFPSIRDAFSFPNVPGGAAPPDISAPPSSPQVGQLNEADLRAIPASLAGSTALVPGAPGTVPPLPVASPAGSPDGAKLAAPADVPTVPPAGEMFSFPGVPAMPSSPPTSPPGGADMAAMSASSAGATPAPGSSPYFMEGEKGASPAAAPVFPTLNEMFSFPRVPAMPGVAGVESIPNVPAAPGSPSATQPAAPDFHASPSWQEGKSLEPKLPAVPVTDMPSSSAYVPDAGNAVYPGTASFPSLSALFSFPGAPGARSAPGMPALPSSPPAIPTTEADLRAAVPPSTVPGLSGSLPDAEKAAPGSRAGTTTLPAGVESFEFRPDLSPRELGVAKRPLDPRLIRRDFPILQEQVHSRPLVWLDNAATTQKPNAVIDRLSYFYRHENSNIHRAAHTLAARATDAYESAREKSRRFLNASSTREIVFVRGTTEGINLIAQAWGRRNVQKGDEVVITWLEHHANIVPWQMLCSEKGARLRVAPVNDRGEIILEEYERLLGPRTKIVSFSQVSNALGTVTPAREMVEIAHRYGARVVVDGAQAVSHMPVDVQALDCDFYVFSGHKVFGPTGIGVVYGKLDVLEAMPPWHGGGNMIVDVTFEKTTYQNSPGRFEAGTGNIADAVGLGAALDYVEEVGRESIAAYEHELLNYGIAGLLTVPGLRLIGTAREKAGVLSFVLDDVRTEDVGVALNQEGIAVRAGHHCAQPILRRMGVEATVRPSLALYNTYEDVDALVAALLRIQSGRGHRNL